MKAILINSEAQLITEVIYHGKLQEIYDLLGCQYVEAPIHFANGDVVYMDEEACLHDDEFIKGGFDCMDRGDQWRIVGNGLLVGTKGEGEDGPPKTTVEEIAKVITWLSKEQAIEHAHGVQDALFTVTDWD
jgi:hypothetical protein